LDSEPDSFFLNIFLDDNLINEKKTNGNYNPPKPKFEKRKKKQLSRSFISKGRSSKQEDGIHVDITMQFLLNCFFLLLLVFNYKTLYQKGFQKDQKSVHDLVPIRFQDLR